MGFSSLLIVQLAGGWCGLTLHRPAVWDDARWRGSFQPVLGSCQCDGSLHRGGHWVVHRPQGASYGMGSTKPSEIKWGGMKLLFQRAKPGPALIVV